MALAHDLDRRPASDHQRIVAVQRDGIIEQTSIPVRLKMYMNDDPRTRGIDMYFSTKHVGPYCPDERIELPMELVHGAICVVRAMSGEFHVMKVVHRAGGKLGYLEETHQRIALHGGEVVSIF